jgi:hypothetical protein
MPVVKETNEVFTQGVEKVVVEAGVDAGVTLPGFFSGMIDLTQLLNAADEMQFRLQVKYSSGGTYRDAEQPSLAAKQADKIFRFTPVEQTYGYKIFGLLNNNGPSGTATLELIVIRSTVPT